MPPQDVGLTPLNPASEVGSSYTPNSADPSTPATTQSLDSVSAPGVLQKTIQIRSDGYPVNNNVVAVSITPSLGTVSATSHATYLNTF